MKHISRDYFSGRRTTGSGRRLQDSGHEGVGHGGDSHTGNGYRIGGHEVDGYKSNDYEDTVIKVMAMKVL